MTIAAFGHRPHRKRSPGEPIKGLQRSDTFMEPHPKNGVSKVGDSLIA